MFAAGNTSRTDGAQGGHHTPIIILSWPLSISCLLITRRLSFIVHHSSFIIHRSSSIILLSLFDMLDVPPPLRSSPFLYRSAKANIDRKARSIKFRLLYCLQV